MSTVTINNTTRTATIVSTGAPGRPGITWDDAGWQADTAYALHVGLLHNGSSYRSIVSHTSSAATEPGVGADWETVWSVLALGSDVEDVETVAGIANEIVAVAAIKDEVVAVAEIDDDVSAVSTVAPQVVSVSGIAADVTAVASIRDEVAIVAARDADIATVANRDADIATVAARDADIGAVASNDANIGTVAANIADVTTAAQNIADIQAAPAAANAAQAWAEGTLPGGPGTKSAKEHAQDASGSAAIAAAATLISYGVALYNEAGIDAGGYYAERMAHVDSVQDHLYAEIIDGDLGSEVSIVMMVGGDAVYGPASAEQGAPLSLSSLSIAVSDTDDVAFMLTPSEGVREIFIKMYGAVTT